MNSSKRGILRNVVSIRGSNTPACTVIVPTYNRRALLQHTLFSLTCQTLPNECFEVIVVDDGSNDGTEQVVQTFKDRLNLNYYWQPDCGFRVAAARNIGLRYARGETVVFLDSGVLAHSFCLQAHLTIHRANPSTAVVGYVYCIGKVQQPRDADLLAEVHAVIDVDRLCLECSQRPGKFDAREPIYRRCSDNLKDLDAPWVVFWTCNVSARAADLVRVGGFDENFRSWGGEDIELAYRLTKSGVSLQLARSAASVHYPHYCDANEQRKTALANYKYFARKHKIKVSDALGPEWTALLKR